MAYKRILVPVDGSPTSSLGLREAIGFARAQKARLQLVHVVDVHSSLMAGAESGAYMTDLVQALTQRGRRILGKAAERVRKAGLACDTVLLETLTGPAAEPILRHAAPNMLVMVAQAAVGLVETYFIGKLGTDALAGVALVFPVVMLMQMMSAGAMGGGISSSIARALGAGRRTDADALA